MNYDNRCVRCGNTGHRSSHCKQPFFPTQPAEPQLCSTCAHSKLPTTEEPCCSCDRQWHGSRLVSTRWVKA